MKFIFLSLLLVSSFFQVAQAEICGQSDDRVISHDPKVGRLSKKDEHGNSCTVTLVGNKCAITAGSCMTSADHAEFNTPLSVQEVPQASKAEDQYLVEQNNSVYNNERKIGENWAVIKFKANEVTGKFPGEVQGFYTVAAKKYPKDEPIRVVSYGYSNIFDFPVQDGDLKNYAQQTSEGTLKNGGIVLLPSVMYYVADLAGGTGAPIISKASNEVLGIGTHMGCQSADKSNAGTFIPGNKKFQEAIAACLAK
jgi:hypothetical protein